MIINTIKAIGIDLVNTLITIDPSGIDDAFGQLVRSLEESGFGIDPDTVRTSSWSDLLIYLDAG